MTENKDGITTSADVGIEGSAVPQTNQPEGVSSDSGEAGTAKKDKKGAGKAAKPKKSTEEVEKKTVTIKSADEKVLSCQIDGVKYEGSSIEVPTEREVGIRQVLVEAGFKLE
jgi:hypothetical protein